MRYLAVKPEDMEAWTSLKETVACSQDWDRFLRLKQGILGAQTDEKHQREIFEDLRDLMKKAVGVQGLRFGDGDYERLNRYRHASFSYGGFPIESIDSEEEVEEEVEEINIGFGTIRRPSITANLRNVLYLMQKTTGDIPIPVMDCRSESGKVEPDLSNLDIEINRQLFNRVYGVLTGQERVDACLECSRLFIPRSQGKPQQYCSARCRSRVSSREYNKKRKKRSRSFSILSF